MLLLPPHRKNREVLVRCLKDESEFLRQVKMQNCKGSLELENASSSGRAVSNQVLFTSHIVLKTDVIPIPSTLTCHHGQREIYCFARNPIRLADASSEPAVVAAGTNPACNSPGRSIPRTRRSAATSMSLSDKPAVSFPPLAAAAALWRLQGRAERGRARLSLPSIPSPGGEAGAALPRLELGEGRPRRKGLTIAAGIRPGAGDAASPACRGGAGAAGVGASRGGTLSGSPAERAPAPAARGGRERPEPAAPAWLAPGGGGVGASGGNPNSSSLACRSCPGCLCSGGGPGPGREGICHP